MTKRGCSACEKNKEQMKLFTMSFLCDQAHPCNLPVSLGVWRGCVRSAYEWFQHVHFTHDIHPSPLRIV